jgi:hypothetical protein
VAGEQAARVAVGPAPEQEEVEDRELDAVAGGEARDQELLVLVGQLLHVVEVCHVDGVHGGLAHGGGDLVEELVLQEAVVGILVVERHGPLVGEEDLPLVELDGILGRAGRRQERLGEGLGEGAAGDGDLEGIVPVEAGRLGLDDVGPEVHGEVIDVCEDEQVGGSGSHGNNNAGETAGGLSISIGVPRTMISAEKELRLETGDFLLLGREETTPEKLMVGEGRL